MAVEKITQPYEFLRRWEDGKFKAYHFKTVTTVKDGDEVLAIKESGAMTAQQAQEAGFPLDEIVDAMHLSTLAALDVANAEKQAALAERDVAIAERDAAVAEKQAAIAERDAAVAEKHALSAEVERLGKIVVED